MCKVDKMMCSTCIFLCVKGETLRPSGNDAENWTDFVNVNVALMKRVCQLNIEQLGRVALYYITQYTCGTTYHIQVEVK